MIAGIAGMAGIAGIAGIGIDIAKEGNDDVEDQKITMSGETANADEGSLSCAYHFGSIVANSRAPSAPRFCPGRSRLSSSSFAQLSSCCLATLFIAPRRFAC